MILIIQNRIPHYRKALFNRLCKLDNVLVVHSGPRTAVEGDQYREVIVPMRRIGPFFFQENLSEVIRREQPQAVIASADVRNLASLIAMLRFDRKVRWVWWGMDQGASTFATRAKVWIGKRRNAIVFYTNKIRDIFLKFGLPAESLFVANNTIHVNEHGFSEGRFVMDAFINVGTLDARKQNDVLIRAFGKVCEHTSHDLFLFLIGEGAERTSLRRLILDLKLEDQVILTGAIEDHAQLRKFYSRALASVSFGQAGLAVLQSMAYGVPFMTKLSAISGGEKDNIINGHNGILCEDDEDSLAKEMLRLVQDHDYCRRLGKNAYEHYRDHASLEGMVAGFQASLAYTRYR